MALGQQLVLIVGPGRSGTSLLAGILRQLGFYSPQPEFPATVANPTGYSESVWVYEFHEGLLAEADVRYIAADRAELFADCAASADGSGAVDQLARWLGEQLEISPRLVVKDPRTVFFLPAWLAAARQLGLAVTFACTFRDPFEVVGSQNHYYQPKHPADKRIEAWMLAALVAETFTRAHPRKIFLYEDLVNQPEKSIQALITLLELDTDADRVQAQDFAQTSLHRIKGRRAAGAISPDVGDRAQSLWELLVELADPAADHAQVLKELDARRQRAGLTD